MVLFIASFLQYMFATSSFGDNEENKFDTVFPVEFALFQAFSVITKTLITIY